MEILTIIAIVVGPIAAVCVTIWSQNRKDRRHAQRRLFFTLMAHRKSNPPPYEWVNALNIIDVVFENCPMVVARWHTYYDLLNQKQPDPSQYHKYLELLSEMARAVGFSTLEQTDIDKFYSPIVHGDQAKMSADTQVELLRVLQNTSHFLLAPKSGKGIK
jgi:hypothetical protein